MKRLLHNYLHSNSKVAQLLRFATVGAKISGIDAALVYLLPFLFGINIYLARVVSLTAANTVGDLLNRYFTFGKDQMGCFYRQMAGHFGIHFMGGLINYGIFSLVVTLGHHHLSKGLALTLLPLLALWIGGLFGLAFNFFLSQKFVFHTREEKVHASL